MNKQFNKPGLAKTSRQLCFLFLLAVCASKPGFSYAEVYKWVDEQGNVHFGDRPPQKEKATNLSDSLKPLNLSTDLSNPGMIRNAEQARQDELNRTRNEQERKQQIANSKQYQEYCKEAKRRLRNISGPVVFYDEQGKQVKVTEKEREKMEQELRIEIEKNCK